MGLLRNSDAGHGQQTADGFGVGNKSYHCSIRELKCMTISSAYNQSAWYEFEGEIGIARKFKPPQKACI